MYDVKKKNPNIEYELKFLQCYAGYSKEIKDKIIKEKKSTSRYEYDNIVTDYGYDDNDDIVTDRDRDNDDIITDYNDNDDIVFEKKVSPKELYLPVENKLVSDKAMLVKNTGTTPQSAIEKLCSLVDMKMVNKVKATSEICVVKTSLKTNKDRMHIKTNNTEKNSAVLIFR